MSGMVTSTVSRVISPQQEAFIALAQTASALGDELERLLRPYGLGRTQYNVLRILRGAGTEGLCRNEIRDRLLSRMPDVTRLLERMADAGLLERERRTDDRRQVSTRLTRRGKDLVDRLDDVVEAEHQRLLGHLGPDQLRTLTRLLHLARAHTTLEG
jgi:DNA-binding MarR family transcriptional regulator